MLTTAYPLLRGLLFRIDPEKAHRIALAMLPLLARRDITRQHCQVMGLSFPNPIGIAAGLDKNGDYLDALGRLGVGFIEVGTVTPQAQSGNPRPRLFRLTSADALINRLGFNNKGIDYLVSRLKSTRYRGVVGVNIGKNLGTDITKAHTDYLHCLTAAYPYASYIAINISSPNTPGLRTLQQGQQLNQLLTVLKSAQADLAARHQRYVPLALKIAPDLDDEQLDDIAASLRHHEIDAVIATNTTSSRTGVNNLPLAHQSGGLSGAPLTERANAVVRRLYDRLHGDIAIIGVGGIMSAADAHQRLAAGANLIQIHTGLIYRGPALIDDIATVLSTRTQPIENTI